MSFYLITDAKTDSTEIDTPVFELPGAGDENAVAIFLSSASAEDYIEAAGWKGDQQVASVKPTETLKWLILAREQGVSQVVVDPVRAEQLQGEPLRGLSLDDPQATFADLLRRASELSNPIEN